MVPIRTIGGYAQSKTTNLASDHHFNHNHNQEHEHD